MKGSAVDAIIMKKYLILLSTSLLLGACSEDAGREINTDLVQEAEQFFGFSEAFGESSYLGNLTYGDYLTIISAELPGCPTIIQNPETKTIELDYSSPQECEQENTAPRTGKIILDFTFADSLNPNWSLTYDNYTFKGSEFTGTRKFVRLSSSENRESFESLTIKSAQELTFVAEGELSYVISRLNPAPVSLTTRGQIQGRNPAGRDFSLVITEAKEQLFQCYSASWELPQKGKESWIVSRTASSSVDYRVSFEPTETCNPVVISTLPDGRSLQLNP